MDTEKRLVEETGKWLSKISKERKRMKPVRGNEQSMSVLENVDAYIKDTDHFLEKGMLVEAFEAVVWAWAWLEIGFRLGVLTKG